MYTSPLSSPCALLCTALHPRPCDDMNWMTSDTWLWHTAGGTAVTARPSPASPLRPPSGAPNPPGTRPRPVPSSGCGQAARLACAHWHAGSPAHLAGSRLRRCWHRCCLAVVCSRQRILLRVCARASYAAMGSCGVHVVSIRACRLSCACL